MLQGHPWMEGRQTGHSSFVEPRSDVKLSSVEQSVAGAVAQVISKLVLFPFDTWKSRLQARRFGALSDFKDLWTASGIYRGALPKIALYAPYQAIYMATYVRAREALLPVLPGQGAAVVLAGFSSEVAGAVVRLPMEVAKVRLQLGVYESSLHAFKELVRHPRSFYGNFVPQTLLHDCSYSAIAWLIFELSRQQLFAHHGEAVLHAHENMLLGVVTGSVTALVTTPLDVLKTRVVGNQLPSVIGALREMWRIEGPRAFRRGAVQRVAHLGPAHGLYMMLYEFAKEQMARS